MAWPTLDLSCQAKYGVTAAIHIGVIDADWFVKAILLNTVTFKKTACSRHNIKYSYDNFSLGLLHMHQLLLCERALHALGADL